MITIYVNYYRLGVGVECSYQPEANVFIVQEIEGSSAKTAGQTGVRVYLHVTQKGKMSVSSMTTVSLIRRPKCDGGSVGGVAT
jgi:hypothetical protein